MASLDVISDDLMEHEFEQALGVGDGQRSLVCCNPWGRKESDTTERLNWTELHVIMPFNFVDDFHILFGDVMQNVYR